MDMLLPLVPVMAPLEEVALVLHPTDNVAILKQSLAAGCRLRWKGREIVTRVAVPAGHKIALVDIPAGQAIRRYGQVIGFATQPIAAGDHVHTHNCAPSAFSRAYEFGSEVHMPAPIPEAQRRTFAGYRRPHGRAGTRNYIAVIASVNCSAHVVRQIARHFTADRLRNFPNVDGVIALAHGLGCAMRVGSRDEQMLRRVLQGMAKHPNVGGCVFVGLGCETMQVELLRGAGDSGASPPLAVTIQESGGVQRTIARGIEAVEALLPQVNQTRRERVPLSELAVALQCGGSDGWSGVTANPVLGLASDAIVREGGTVVLAETPEIYGAEHLLVRRAVSREVGEKLLQRVRWWEMHAAHHGVEIDNNPSPGNKAGGLTTIYEKSLGAIAKAGSTPLMDVLDYAEPLRSRGFVFMDSPGYDPVSVTGQVASGCNLVVFTTGRGSCFGFKPAPSIKVASNSDLFHRMREDMDFDAGRVLHGASLQTIAEELLELIIAVASGQPTRSEAQGIGEEEFLPWHLGSTL